MKKIALFLMLLQFAIIAAFAQGADDKVEQIRILNQKVVAQFKAGKLEEAQRLGQEALKAVIEHFGDRHSETASAYSNLGEIFNARKKYSEAAGNFRKALDIYKLAADKNRKDIARVFDSLAISLALGGKSDDGEKTVEEFVAFAETSYGAESKDLLPILKTARSYFAYKKIFEKAEKLFVREYRLTRTVFGTESAELENVSDDFFCYTTQFSPDKQMDKTSEFNVAADKGIEPDFVRIPAKLEPGVINGKAVFLAKPEYSPMMRASGFRGLVHVSVLVDEGGVVVKAKAMCITDEIVKKSVEEAAMKSLFRPTEYYGVPIKISGTISYQF